MKHVGTSITPKLYDRINALDIADCESFSSKLRRVAALGVDVAENNSNHHGLGR